MVVQHGDFVSVFFRTFKKQLPGTNQRIVGIDEFAVVGVHRVIAVHGDLKLISRVKMQSFYYSRKCTGACRVVVNQHRSAECAIRFQPNGRNCRR